LEIPVVGCVVVACQHASLRIDDARADVAGAERRQSHEAGVTDRERNRGGQLDAAIEAGDELQRRHRDVVRLAIVRLLRADLEPIRAGFEPAEPTGDGYSRDRLLWRPTR